MASLFCSLSSNTESNLLSLTPLQLIRIKTERENSNSPPPRAHDPGHVASSPQKTIDAAATLAPSSPWSPIVPGKTPNLNEPRAAAPPPPTPLDAALIEYAPRCALLPSLRACPTITSDSLARYFKALSRLELRSLDPAHAVESGARALSSIKPALSPHCHAHVTVAGLRALRFLCQMTWIRDQLHSAGAVYSFQRSH